MRVLLDECLPRRLKNNLSPHEARTVAEMGWSGVKNGALLGLAEAGFDVFLTVDRNLQYQQHVSAYNISIIVLIARSNAFERLQPLVPLVLEALQQVQAGEVRQVGNEPHQIELQRG